MTLPQISLLSMTWVEMEPPQSSYAYACDGEYIYERVRTREGDYLYRRAHWTAVALVVNWDQLPAFLWENVKPESDPQRMNVNDWAPETLKSTRTTGGSN